MQDEALERTSAARWVALALANVTTEYPNKLDQLLTGAADLAAPRTLHPVFYGSYDWHSTVHMHWLLVRLLRLVPDVEGALGIAAHFDRHFTPAAMAVECAYLKRPGTAAFERTYGWAWLLRLALELDLLQENDQRAARWAQIMAPLAQAFVERYLDYLPRADYPVRAGTHANSAFGLLFALEYARRTGHETLQDLVVGRALAWFGSDCRYPAQYEPSNSDFLSAGLLEAVLMGEVLDARAFSEWWHTFEPPGEALDHWLRPVRVADRTDPQIVHLDGLNLSRAWCWSRLVAKLPDRLLPLARKAKSAHLTASLAQVLDGHYVGTHWLASFALLALSEP